MESETGMYTVESHDVAPVSQRTRAFRTHVREQARLSALRALEILDTPSEKAFDDLVRLATSVCDAPTAVIALVDEHRQWFKAQVGLTVSATEASRHGSFCSHVVTMEPDEDFFLVPDARDDARFRDHPMVTGEPHLRFYAGVPLRLSDGNAVGTLCVLDYRPRNLGVQQREGLQALRRQVEAHLELRRTRIELRDARHSEATLMQSIVHDLRNPLSAICMSTGTLIDVLGDVGGPDDSGLQDARDAAHDVADGAEALRRLLSNISDVGRTREGEALRVARGPVDLAGLIQQLRKGFESRGRDRGVDLRFSFVELTFVTDATVVLRILETLLDLAIRRAPRTSTVRLAVHEHGDTVVFDVEDTGELGVREKNEIAHTGETPADGMPPDSRLLNLAFCRIAAAALRGRILVEAPERGNRFRLLVPTQ